MTGRVRLMAPNGLAIRGTVESCPITYPARVYRLPDGTVEFEYTGGESKVWDEGAELVMRAPEGGGKPESVFEDTSGNEWLESELVPDPDADPAEDDQ